MTLETRYADGQLAALARLKLAFPAATHPVVQDSATLQSQSTKSPSQAAKQRLEPPTNPFDVSQLFSVHEQAETRTEPRRKLSGELCTTCRREKHYGPCSAPRKIPKTADFNAGLRGDDPTQGDNPSTSPHYHAATTADSSLARARDGRPADEQAGTYFADLFRHLGIQSAADEPGRMTGGLHKVARHPRLRAPKLGDWQLWGTDGHSSHEQRGPGPTSNPYEERLTVKSPPIGWGDEGEQRIRRAFDQIDCAVDTTGIEDASKGQPEGGPAVLG